MIDYASLMPAVARKIWGEPNPRHSTKSELRWGRNGSRKVDIETGTFYDFEREEGGGVLDLLAREGLNPEWLRENGFLNGTEYELPRRKIVVTYDYENASGELNFQVCRFEPKGFAQRRPDGRGGWQWKTGELVPYRLPELIEAVALERPIFIPEGEKDVETLRAYGADATCNAGGAKKWRPELSKYFQGADVVVLPDNDDAGREHAQAIAASLQGKAACVRILELPGLPHKGDVSDWFEAGGTIEAFNELVEKAAAWAPATEELVQGKETPPPSFSEAAVAGQFVDRHAGDLRYVDEWTRWLQWDGSRWIADNTRRTFSLALTICKEAAAGAPNDSIKRSIASSKTRAATVTLAGEDRRMAAEANDWDTDPFSFNTKKRGPT